MNSVLTPLLAMTAWFLGLSILVQVLQELWKFVTSSKARSFEKALSDFLGPFVVGRLKQDPLLAVRGPLQFRRVSTAGRVLPLNAADLSASLEKSAPEWQRLVRRALAFEASAQRSGPAPPTPAFLETVRALERQITDARALMESADRRLGAEALGLGDAGNVHTFLEKWNLTGDTARPRKLDAATVQLAFAREFFPQEETIGRHYDQFLENFGFQYRRRNLRQTFTFAMLVAVMLNLPFEQIYLRATMVSPEEAIALAENAQQLYQQAASSTDQASRQQLETFGKQALDIARSAADFACTPRDADLEAPTAEGATTPPPAGCEVALSVDYFLDPAVLWRRLTDRQTVAPRFLFGCMLTAILITFGAPFWNDLSSTLLRVARPTGAQAVRSTPDRTVKLEVE
jgi:hypothetical protein